VYGPHIDAEETHEKGFQPKVREKPEKFDGFQLIIHIGVGEGCEMPEL
jgi:hypothetical protein